MEWKRASTVWRSAMVLILLSAILGTAMARAGDGQNLLRLDLAGEEARATNEENLRRLDVGETEEKVWRRGLAAQEANESSLLLKFKSLITLDPSGALQDWTNSSSSACRWNAIVCNSDGFVSSIDLSDLQLAGSISDSLGELSSLASLNLSHNNLSGAIPPTLLPHAASLVSLDLSFNLLDGYIPSNISAPRLATLNLHNNSFTGSIPASLGSCGSLISLNLYYNKLSGRIPVELGNLVHLKALTLSFNQLYGPIPTAIYTNCTNLTVLAVSEMALTGVLPPEIGRLSSLVQLWMDGNQFSGNIPDEIGNLTLLNILRISENNFTGSMPASIGKLVSLTTLLSLSNNQLTGPIPPEVGNLTNLQILTVIGNFLNGTIPTELGNLRNLQGLFLANNMFSGTISGGALARCSDLQRLTLNNNLLVGSIPPALGSLQFLYELHLDRNFLQGSIPASFSNLTRLQDVSFGYNSLTGSLSTIATSASGSTQFTMPHNAFDGPLPSELGNMIHVENIDLSSNKLYGKIPESLVNCVSLAELNLSFNSLNGTIPELQSLTFLQSLDLSGNNLSGPIPDFLSNLPLVYLNLSFNNFTGQIPTRGVFAHLNASSFLSNGGLCGHPSSRACPIAYASTSPPSSHSGLSVGLTVLVVICSILVLAIFLLLLRYACYVNRRITTSHPDKDGSPLFSGGQDDHHYRVLKFTAQELEAATENFNGSRIIGTGSVSKVYRATNLAIRVAPAVKILDAAIKRLRPDYRSSLTVELKTLGVIRHRNLVELYGYCDDGDVQALVLEFLARGSLQEHLHADEPVFMSLRLRLQIALNVAHGMAYLHHGLKRQIVHRDLKPCNILLDENMVAKVADFGLAKLLGPETLYTALKGTPGYLAPECGETLRVTAKGDVYSFGVVVLELLTRRKPTDEMFRKMGVTLPSWVRAAYPDMYREILDPPLREDSLELTGDEALRGMLQVGLACTESKPDKRPDMEKVVKMLSSIDYLLSADIKASPSPRSPYDASNDVDYALLNSKY